MVKKVLIVLFSLFALFIGGGVSYLRFFFPKMRAASTEKIDATPERLARGKYLVENVLECYGCHTSRDFTRYAGPIERDGLGQGGECFDEQVGFPGKVCAQNITADVATGLGAWTDGEIMRAIREGVSRDGRPLFPMMPYKSYRRLSDEDAQAIVAYIRTTPPIQKYNPEGYVKFPVSLFIRREPTPLDGPVPAIDRKDTAAYGEYLSVVANCTECHTPIDPQMQQLEERKLSGGRIFIGPWGTVVAPNLTTDPTGLGSRTKQEFISLFKAYSDPAAAVEVTNNRNTLMPWFAYAAMTEEDLGAIYDYLQTIPKINNPVERWPKPTQASLPK